MLNCMSNTSNYLLFYEDYIQFRGFKVIDSVVAFCLYPNGIAIYPGIPAKRFHYHYVTAVDENGRVTDKELIQILRERGYKDKESFIFIDGYYLQTQYVDVSQ